MGKPTPSSYGGKARTAREPFVFRVTGDPDLGLPDSPDITVHEPDGGTVMELLDPGTSMRRGLRLLIGGEQWPLVEEQLEHHHIDTTLELMRDLTDHFEIERSFTAQTSRAERRRKRRR